MNQIKYRISISLIDGCIKNGDAVKLHHFTGFPITYFRSVDSEVNVPLGEIVNEQFYSGVKEIVELVKSLKSNYQLFSNCSEIELGFLDDIVYKINNIKLSDIR